MTDWRPEPQWNEFIDEFEKMGRKWDAVYTAFRQGEYRNSLAAPMKTFHEAMCLEIGEMRKFVGENEQELDAHFYALTEHENHA